MKIKLIIIENGIQKQNIWQFQECVDLKIGISEAGNGVKVTEDLREGDGWVTDGYGRIIADYALNILKIGKFGLG